MISQDHYYAVLQSVWQTGANLIAYFSFLVLLTIFLCIVMLSKTIHFRLLMFRKYFYFFKCLAFLLELIFLPVLLNIVHYGIC